MTDRIRAATVDVAYPTVALCAGIVVWWGVAAAADVPSYVLPSPGVVAAQLLGDPALYARSARHTFEKIAYGGTIGVFTGLLLALFVAYVPWFRRAVYPYLVTVRVLPKLAVAPLLLIYLGTGMATATVFVALITFFPLVLNAAAGLDRSPEAARELLQSVDVGPLARVVYVDIPYALPDVFAGLKQSVTLAVVGAVVAEWVVADSGLGFVILIASENLRPDVMLAALAVLILEGLFLYGAVVLVQRIVDRLLGLEPDPRSRP